MATVNTDATYEQDFYAWTQEQAALLKAGKLTEIDIANIAEELEDMGKSQRNQLVTRLGVLLAHLLKWRHQSERRRYGNSWKYTIKGQRRRIQRLLAENPSLKSKLDPLLLDAYGDAVLMAARETGFEEEQFPASCPWRLEQILDNDFWPD
ncbi:MAG: DUF29 domain-containing protein [Candidatus Competibacteraceae bacterium]